jgi:hypothetical protein
MFGRPPSACDVPAEPRRRRPRPPRASQPRPRAGRRSEREPVARRRAPRRLGLAACRLASKAPPSSRIGAPAPPDRTMDRACSHPGTGRPADEPSGTPATSSVNRFGNGMARFGPPVREILGADQGQTAREASLRPTTGPVGDTCDGATAEAFFATRKREPLGRRSFRTRAGAWMAVFHPIGGFCDPSRRHPPSATSPVMYDATLPPCARAWARDPASEIRTPRNPVRASCWRSRPGQRQAVSRSAAPVPSPRRARARNPGSAPVRGTVR